MVGRMAHNGYEHGEEVWGRGTADSGSSRDSPLQPLEGMQPSDSLTLTQGDPCGISKNCKLVNLCCLKPNTKLPLVGNTMSFPQPVTPALDLHQPERQAVRKR